MFSPKEDTTGKENSFFVKYGGGGGGCGYSTVFFNRLSWFLSELPEKDISDMAVQCR